WMDHDDNIGPPLKGLAVAGLLVGAIAPILLVDDNGQTEPSRHRDGPVFRTIIDQDDLRDIVPRDIGDGFLQGLLSIISGHDNDRLHRWRIPMRGNSRDNRAMTVINTARAHAVIAHRRIGLYLKVRRRVCRNTRRLSLKNCTLETPLRVEYSVGIYWMGLEEKSQHKVNPVVNEN